MLATPLASRVGRCAAVASCAIVLVTGCAVTFISATSRVGPRDPAEQGGSAPAAPGLVGGPSKPGFAQVVETVKPAVFSVRVRIAADEKDLAGRHFNNRRGRPPGMPQEPRFVTSQGSGFFISADGYAVTNNHVVKGAKSAEIRTDDGKTYTAKVIGADSASDLALLKVDGKDDFPVVAFAEAAPQVGDWIITIGNPFGLGGTVTAGIVSARGRDMIKDSYEDLIQIDAPVNRGSSGGPTFDLNGNVIGINTMIYSPTGASIGIAFDIPAERVKSVVGQLKERGAVIRASLGMQVQAVSPEIAESLDLAKAAGVLVADLQPDGPAAAAGIRTRDVIDSVNEEPVRDSHDFARRMETLAPGKAVALQVLRQGEQKAIIVVATEVAPSSEPAAAAAEPENKSDSPQLGLTLLPSGTKDGNGVVVTDVDPGGLAADRGLEPGDVILDVASQAVTSPDDVNNALSGARAAGKRTVMMRVRSGKRTQFIIVPTG